MSFLKLQIDYLPIFQAYQNTLPTQGRYLPVTQGGFFADRLWCME